MVNRNTAPIDRVMLRTVCGPFVDGLEEPCLDCTYALAGDGNPTGYPTLSIKGKGYRAGRIVLEHTIGRAVKPGMFVLHKCDRTVCVRPSHLYEGSHIDNMTDRRLRGRAARQRGENNAAAKLTASDVKCIRELHSQGILQYKIAEQFNMSKSHICTIISRKRWGWLIP